MRRNGIKINNAVKASSYDEMNKESLVHKIDHSINVFSIILCEILNVNKS